MKHNNDGQALVILLFYMIIAIMLSTTAIAVVAANSLSVTRNEEGFHALELAEAGAENALLRLVRSTDYAGESLTIAGGAVTVSVAGNNEMKFATSSGTVGNFTRSVQITTSIINGVVTLTSWEEL